MNNASPADDKRENLDSWRDVRGRREHSDRTAGAIVVILAHVTAADFWLAADDAFHRFPHSYSRASVQNIPPFLNSPPSQRVAAHLPLATSVTPSPVSRACKPEPGGKLAV